MSIGAVSGAGSADLQANNLGLQDFMKILLTQLTYQDPLKPMDNQAFMAQMAQFTALQQAQDTNSKMDTLISTQSALQSVGLIGKIVDVATSSGQVTGTVNALNFSTALPTFSITPASGGLPLTNLSLSQINAVRTTL
ncbi:flagellar basal-body rod modification protein FlgD [Duganella sacchari]|uniref:Basal-body rod modification protein FlgD n=1 Tax=Duganella sacchari TaxID=551987 RepID=A0A1M7PL30_9BURK|nr:flagellar hook capping FlgD N-terminal domain-containing protein [Duganella sacchari]SHN17949.1 flagellar basal-body rod modification protein FlgD [Duganella sacchari]